ncbi:uncharacterized protein BDW43DRAFT_271245 [Aspergillus alliaceus]|uniref:uncharacterized protein n=1 Tax=Petromyces alliaceus TaxID=209559 RepID=UPI0012A4F3FC|nr:uncharacterized protein BDW43DRAFT_271245 [Aspergillus alliaceus]KAB8235193.1 hypothetical protein BDW43DRAFT_271245 [Aspergillus alliaceus]
MTLVPLQGHNAYGIVWGRILLGWIICFALLPTINSGVSTRESLMYTLVAFGGIVILNTFYLTCITGVAGLSWTPFRVTPKCRSHMPCEKAVEVYSVEKGSEMLCFLFPPEDGSTERSERLA